MCTTSLVSNIRQQLVPILSLKNFKLTTDSSLYKWVFYFNAISVCFCFFCSWNVVEILFIWVGLHDMVGRYGTLLDKRDSKVLELRFTEGRIAVFLRMMWTSWGRLIHLTTGTRNFSNRLVILVFLINNTFVAFCGLGDSLHVSSCY